MSTATHRMRGLDAALTALGALLLAALILVWTTGGFSFGSSSGPAGIGSGAAAEQVRSLPPFTGVVLAGDNNVVVRAGARQSVVVHADRNLLDRVTTRVRAGRLVIGTTPGNLSAKSPMFVVVSTRSVEGLELAGFGNITVTGIDERSLTVKLPGSGNIEASGAVANLEVTVGGEGNALLRGLTARDAKADLSGSGSIMLTATHGLTARLSGSGTILYGGDPPHVAQRVTGSGTISAG